MAEQNGKGIARLAGNVVGRHATKSGGAFVKISDGESIWTVFFNSDQVKTIPGLFEPITTILRTSDDGFISAKS